MVARSGCGLLLDVNNVYVSSQNLGLDAHAFIAGLPAASVREIHLAGHERSGRRADRSITVRACATRSGSCTGYAIGRFGPLPTLIEWDTDIPTLATLVAESRRAQRILDQRHGLAA